MPENDYPATVELFDDNNIPSPSDLTPFASTEDDDPTVHMDDEVPGEVTA